MNEYTLLEQGSGRYPTNNTDTLNKFILMSKPSVGYKNIPLPWIPYDGCK